MAIPCHITFKGKPTCRLSFGVREERHVIHIMCGHWSLARAAREIEKADADQQAELTIVRGPCPYDNA